MRSLSFIPLKPNKHTLEISVFFLRDLFDTVYGVVYNHITFRKKGRQPITVPRHNPIKKAYIEIIRNAIKDET